MFHALKNTLVSQGDKKVPCGAGIQNEDHSQALKASDGKTYRSVIGLLLYVARERADILFTVKELAACMSAPNLCSLQRLRKLVGYLKNNGGMGIKLKVPQHGEGKWKTGGEKIWMLESFTDAD